MWPYPSNSRPASWQHYYGHSSSSTGADEQRRATVTSGIAAGLTLIVFFTIFLLTFGCRLYNRSRRQQQSFVDSLSFVCSPAAVGQGNRRPPLPSYENALRMPAFPSPVSSPPPSIDAPFRAPKPPKKTPPNG
uniref:Uncharacterized protein n=1 Tax=Globodera rostochiensis TaxID=31243 RepID=A0A914HHK3_GLORO